LTTTSLIGVALSTNAHRGRPLKAGGAGPAVDGGRAIPTPLFVFHPLGAESAGVRAGKAGQRRG
jgi:hypothetical protein